jgi:peptide/nickel transport system permease protein
MDSPAVSTERGLAITAQSLHAAPKARRWQIIRSMARNRAALAGAVIVLVFVALAVLALFWTPYPADVPVLDQRLGSPSWSHPLGNDDVGRDIFSRLIVGARYSLYMGITAVAISAAIGIPLGLIAGYRGGVWDTLVMRVIDVLMVLPTFVLAVAIVSVLGAGILSVIIAVSVTSVPAFARLARATTLTLREQDFVAAARVVGARDTRILTSHILPNTLAPLVVQVSLGIGTTILTASALGFLGLGVQPPTPEWGAMLSRGRTFISSAPHLVIFPGVAIASLVTGFNLLGDGLRDAMDPRFKSMTDS